jgi:hypothetical protein
LNVAVSSEGGTTIFESGRWNTESANIDHIDDPYEPHYDVIQSEEQVLIYQSLMGDVDGELTWTLLRGASYLKDNRLPPEGFTSDGVAYDSTKIVGSAAEDPNFNRDGDVEGTGSDRVTYRIGGLTQTTPYVVSARLLYQALSRGFVDDLAQYPGQEVADFNDYYSRIDESPITVDSIGLSITATSVARSDTQPDLRVELYPNPASEVVTFTLEGWDGPVQAVVYDLVGKVVARIGPTTESPGRTRLIWRTNGISDGVYVYRVTAGRRSVTGKIILLH